jgi:hypothetical protein
VRGANVTTETIPHAVCLSVREYNDAQVRAAIVAHQEAADRDETPHPVGG